MKRLLALVVLLAPQAWAVDIVGQVVEDHSGEPLASARVKVKRAGQRTLAADRDTDREGRFSAFGLQAGEYWLEVSKSNYAAMASPVSESGETTVRLVKLGVIDGRILDAQGIPISGGFVFVRPEAPNDALYGTANDRTNANGEYRVHGLLPGRYSLAASLAGVQGNGAGAMAYPEVLAISGGDEHRGVDFLFPATSLHAIEGTVQAPEENTNYAVSLVARERPELMVAATRTKNGGAFQLENVPAGSYRLFASGPAIAYGGRGVLLGAESLYGYTDVDVLGQDVGNVSIEVAPGVDVSVVLASEVPLPAGVCPEQAPLRLLPLEDRASQLMSSGQLSFSEPLLVKSLAPGRYRMALGQLGDSCFQTGDIVLDTENAADVVQALVTPAGWIEGQLVGAGPGYAVVLATAHVPIGGIRVEFADAGGRFVFDALPPGKYRIGVRSPNKPDARYIPEDLSQLFEVEVAGGGATEIDLPVRAQ